MMNTDDDDNNAMSMETWMKQFLLNGYYVSKYTYRLVDAYTRLS